MGNDPLAKFKTKKEEEKKTTVKTDPLAKFKSSEQPKKPETKAPKPKLSPNVRRLIEDEAEQPLQPQRQTTTTTKAGNKVTPQAKIASKDLKRPDNPFAPFLVNALNTATLGAFERNTDAIDQLREKSPVTSTIGSMAGYLAPFGAAKGALVKGTQTVGKRLLTDAAIGAGVDTANELVKGKNDIKTAAKNVGMGAAFGIAADLGLSALGKIGQSIVKNLDAGKLVKIPTTQVDTKTTAIKSLNNPLDNNTFRIKNTKHEEAINEYNAAIETIQNHFKTSELRADEANRIKSELGIDLNAIIKKIDDTEQGINIRDISEQRRMADVAGVKPLPKLNLPQIATKSIEPPKLDLNTNTQPIIKSGLKTNVDEIGEDLLNDATYKELTDELKDVNITPDTNIKSIATSIKDKSGLTLNVKDVYRNMRDAFGKNFDYVKKNYLNPLDASKKAYTDEVKTYTDDIYNRVVKGLKINKGTKESAAIQNFGEGLTTKEKLVEDFGEQKAKDIIEADSIFRKTYDELIDKVNAVRAQIYPNNAEKIVPKRKDYYRHFNEMAEGFQGLKNIFDTPSQIDPKLAGMSEFTKPGAKWASYMQKRGDGEYTADAVGGFLEYIQPAAYSIHIDPHINKFRSLGKDIAEATQYSKNANNTIKYLNDFANNLAGKTNKYDRIWQEDIPGGRTTFRAINWLNSRVKANQVLGNASSSLSQFANVPIGVARIKNPVHLAQGAGQTLAGIVGKGNKAMKQSQFINERNIGDLISRFDKKIINQPKKFAAWILGGADKLGTNFIWNSAYNNAVAKGNLNPVKYADDMARSIVAGRGIGEVPLLQQAKTFQLIAPFQLEVANLWSVMGDTIKEKDFAAIALILTGNYLFNNLTEGTTGNRVTFDPINAMEEALAEDDTSAGKVAGRVAGEVLSNIPLGQTLAAQYPEYGADISTPLGSLSLPSRTELFGDEDPTRFGGGLLVTKALTDPLYKIAPPFGGAQAKKTIEGLGALNKGMVERNGKMSFPVEKNTENIIKSALFGKYSTDEAREYFDKDRRPLSEKQTTALLKKPNIKSEYEKTMDKRKIDTLTGKIKSVKADKTLSDKEKQTKIKKYQQEINTIRRN